MSLDVWDDRVVVVCFTFVLNGEASYFTDTWDREPTGIVLKIVDESQGRRCVVRCEASTVRDLNGNGEVHYLCASAPGHDWPHIPITENAVERLGSQVVALRSVRRKSRR